MNYSREEQAILDAFQYALDNDLFRNTAAPEYRRAKTNKALRKQAKRFALHILAGMEERDIDHTAKTYRGRDLSWLYEEVQTAVDSGRWPLDTLTALAAINLIEGGAE